MGFRFRKSKKVGPFRINFSKKGVGWSVGSKWFRYTKKAGGGSRTTTSIPGTGISFVQDYKSGKHSSKKKKSSNSSGPGTSIFTNSSAPVSTPPSPPPSEHSGLPSGCLTPFVRIFQWCVCGFLLLSALVFLFSLTSLFCLLAGLLILPVDRWQQWLKRYIPVPTLLRYLASTVFFFIALAFYANPATAPAAATAIPTPAPTIVAAATATPAPTPVHSPSPTVAPTATPTATPSPTPAETPVPTPEPTPEATPIPTPVATPDPTPAVEAAAETNSDTQNSVMVWIPTNGGTKYHSKASCSQMVNPQQVTLDEAVSMGFTPCKRCYG